MKKLLMCLAIAVGGLTLFASTNKAEAHGGPMYRGGYRSFNYGGNYGGGWNGYRTNFYRGGCGPYGCYNNYNNYWYGGYGGCNSGLYLNTPGFGFSTYGW